MHRNYGLRGAATWGAPHIREQAYPAFGGALFLQGAHRFGVRSLWGCTNIGNTLFFEMANYFGGGLASACLDIRDFPGFASELCTGIMDWGVQQLGVRPISGCRHIQHLGVHSSFRVRTDLECALFGGAQISGTRSFLKWRTISGAGLPRHVGISGIFRDSHRNYAPAFGGALFLQGAHRFGVRTLWGCRNIWNTFFLCRVPEVSAAACAAHLRCRPLPACRST